MINLETIGSFDDTFVELCKCVNYREALLVEIINCFRYNDDETAESMYNSYLYAVDQIENKGECDG